MFVIGTAGHVDHGKSTLVEALTGIDPDRLREEKERGMTIDLGFAWLKLPSGNEVSIVDVPGHERFVNNMLAGVGGIDLALLVVAADESVMPQTREHLAILDLLRIERGLVALTKKDLVEEDWLDLVVADIEEALEGTALEGSAILPVSGTTNDGLPELVEAMDGLLAETTPKKDVSRPRLPIDRAFTITGFGTVVTGTLIDGSLEVGQEVELVVSGQRTRIRGLQTHRQKEERAEPGTRVAANLIGVGQDDIRRGEVLTTPGWLRPTAAFDVHLRAIPEAPLPLRHNMFITVHTGSSEVVARLRLFEGDRLYPGETTWAQLKLESQLAVAKGDYFVVRSNLTTLGGGNIVDSHARRPRRNHPPTIERLQVMERGTDREVLLKTIELSEPSEFVAIVNRANLNPDAAKSKLEAMAADGEVIVLGKGNVVSTTRFYSAGGWSALGGKTRDALGAYHRQFPLRLGAPKEELRSRLILTPQVFNDALVLLNKGGVTTERGALVGLPDHRPTLSDADAKAVDDYIKLLESDPYSPPTDSPLHAEIVSLLDDEGKVVKVSDNVVFASSAYKEMVDKISAHINEHGEVTVADVRDLFGTSRKYALALMDHMDHQRITRRVGDARVLR
ncbi:MAG: selenocysteine-specific translation elongation factor [SAR202 cluster bacterium]|nr:selenocysteine-specific translation elongation factor [SAR202 cluster bacterium]